MKRLIAVIIILIAMVSWFIFRTYDKDTAKEIKVELAGSLYAISLEDGLVNKKYS